MKYFAKAVNATVSGNEITMDDTGFEMHYISVISTVDDFTLSLYSNGAYGEEIPCAKNVGFESKFNFTRFRLKCSSATVAVTYFVRNDN